NTAAAQAAASAKPGTLVFGTYTGRLELSFPNPASVASFSPGTSVPELAYATLGDDAVHVYNFGSRANLTLTGAGDVVDTLAFSGDGAYLIAAGRDNSARVYYAVTGGPAIETLAGHQNRILQAGFGRADELIATASDDGTARVWTGPTLVPEQMIPPQPGRADALAQTLTFSADGKQVLEAAADGLGRLLDAHSLRVRSTFSAPAGQGFAGAAQSRDGRVVAALSGPYDPAKHVLRAFTQAELYDSGSGRPIATLAPSPPALLANAALDYAGERLVTLELGGDADEWDARTGRRLGHLPGTNIAAAAAFSRDGARLAVVHYPRLPASVRFGTVFGPIAIDLFDARTGRLERTIQGDTLTPQVPGEKSYAPLTVAFSPNGKLLAVGGAAPDVRIYDPRTGSLVASLGLTGTSVGDYAYSLAFSPDGSLLAIGAAAGATVWRVPASGGGFQPLPAFEHVPPGDFPSVVGNGFGVSAGFTNDSRYLVTAGDTAIEAWDLTSHLQLFRASSVDRGSMSSASDELVTARGDGVALYSCDACGGLSRLLAVAKRDTTAQLTPAQRATYLKQG
ncbi:MAG: hypothetical protein JO206_04265, partial [Solirubrobacterales bacterium]|nr:hypothetical protein [Solirubrobacterales bacterium]